MLFYLHDMSCYQDHPWYDGHYTTKIRQLYLISNYFLLQRTGRTGRKGWSHGSPGITRDTRTPRNNRDARNTRLGSMTHYYYYLWQKEIKICFLQAKKGLGQVGARF